MTVVKRMWCISWCVVEEVKRQPVGERVGVRRKGKRRANLKLHVSQYELNERLNKIAPTLTLTLTHPDRQYMWMSILAETNANKGKLAYESLNR